MTDPTPLHPSKICHPHLDEDLFTCAAYKYMRHYGCLPCTVAGKKVSTQCKCLHALVTDDFVLAAACRHLVEFYCCDKNQRYSSLMNLYGSAWSFALSNNEKMSRKVVLRGKCFPLTLTVFNNSNKSCMSAFQLCQVGVVRYFGIGIWSLARLKASLKDGKATPHKHGFSGKKETTQWDKLCWILWMNSWMVRRSMRIHMPLGWLNCIVGLDFVMMMKV